MSILVSKIVSRMASALDAENSDRYLFDQDYKPAINYAVEWLVTVFNQAFAEKKLSPEALRELTKVKIWQANKYSRIAYNAADTGHQLWTILAVYPDPKINKKIGYPTLIEGDDKSKLMPDVSYIGGAKGANRLTLEEWNNSSKNVFMPGNSTLKGELLEYAYLDFADYSSTSYNNPGKFEIEIKPEIPGKFCAIAYVAQPKEITSSSDNIEFPESLMNLVTERGLAWIATKMGDQTNLFGITEKDTTRLVGLMK